MLCAHLVEPRRFEVSEFPLPTPGPNEVLFFVECCGVCSSNLAPWRGAPWFTYPLPPGAPGHEAVGTVEAVGREVTAFKEGDHILAMSYRGFAEFDTAPEDAVVSLPESLEQRNVLGEPLACAINVFRRSGILPTQTVAIVGIGFLGGLLLQLTRSAGARSIAICRRAFAGTLAKELGASWVVVFQEREATRQMVAELTENRMCDVVIEAVGTQEALDLASDLVTERGRLIIAGYHQDGPRMINLQSWNWRGLDVVNAHERDPVIYIDGMKESLKKLDEGSLSIELLLTHPYSLSDVQQAFETAEQRPEGFVKAYLENRRAE
jgi:threonine dehydrogenase-like Zn-dependent dehydrogenase